METLATILVLLAVTRLFGELAERAGQSALVGELISGVLLGIAVAGFGGAVPALAALPHSPAFRTLADLGMFFLMLLAGIEMQPRDLAKSSGRGMLVALGGVVVPLGLGAGLAWLVIPDSPYKLAQCLFLGTAMAVTAVPVTVRILMDLKQLHTPMGRTIVSAALADDVFSLILLAILTGLIGTGTPSGAAILLLFGKVALFFAITISVGWIVFPWVGKFFKGFRSHETDFSMLVIAGLAYAVLAELLGLHFIVGAFIAGVFFERRTVDLEAYERVEKQIRGITVGFLAPLFFASIGLQLDLGALRTVPAFVSGIIIIAFLGKFLGAGAPAYWSGLPRHEAYMVGVAMSARGAVELVVAGVALEAGLFRHPDPPPPIVEGMFSAVVVMAIVTTILAPILLRRLARDG